MAEVDSMMFSMAAKLKNKHTSIKRRCISKTITSVGYRVEYVYLLRVLNSYANVD